MKHKTLLNYLKKYHYGADKAASSGVLEVAFSVTGREIRKVNCPNGAREITLGCNAVNTLRSDGEPICSDENGYYYAKNEQELQHSIRQLDSRIGQIERAKKGLEKALPIYSNQNGGSTWN